ncbi:superoxide dismutase [Poseidonibacter ostreae]|jgi:superoxide dismutase, Fe-Mn family|uniref:Superoxide dismutase n=1 Tax=Poseidonibacter ostreae TaxID=2654171 RepID=A0A6L4WPB9_9BACT|nr:superoxide dismutase [Poseidonibacter ostreae]KAB7885869.1 superoxide dismutase [Fe] [Poseidonibacter ostreae]KAB7888434.1 superoxide dismutase [Fe] [Poseidonibacter ostreae]MAC83020.1 superoxide dismutase [Fe] [Arcobacter sp.]
MKHVLMTLPYTLDALEPMMSKETLEFHYGKHHQTYINKLNELILDTKYQDLSLVEIIADSEGGVFNNAAQVYNHDFFWKGLTPNQKELSSKLQSIIEENFSSLEEFKKDFTAKAVGHFGSGWAWLVQDENKKLQIVTTANAQTPLAGNLKPLLVCDVWEHAYYIDVRNARPSYLENFWKLVNWDFVEENLA